MALPPHPQFMQQFVWGGRPNFSRLEEPVSCNQLMAIELDSGKLKWQIGGRGDKARGQAEGKSGAEAGQA